MVARNIVFRAPLTSQSGYGVHSRQVARWLLDMEKSGHDVHITFDLIRWGMNPCYADPASCDGLIGEITSRNQKRGSYDISLQLQLPHEWDPALADINIGLTAAVETDRCNPSWVDAVNEMDLVIVPSAFTRRVLEDSGKVRTKVVVVPESWIPACADVQNNNHDPIPGLELETDFNFLIFSQFAGDNAHNDRKNIALTIKWIMEEFHNCPGTGIIIKTNTGDSNVGRDHKETMARIKNIESTYRKGATPNIHVLHGHMSDKELVNIYTHPQVRAMVSLTRGEAFGLPILEAATCGLPVIATDWSGHTEFLRQGKYIKIKYALDCIHPSRVDHSIFLEKARWANPLENDFKRKIRRFYDNPGMKDEQALKLREKLLVSHSQTSIQSLYYEALKSYL